MYYRQPRYYSTFQCIGSDCPDNCCYGWNIDWKKDEVEKLKNAPNISPKLRELVDKAFVWSDMVGHEYFVKFDERKRCPCVTDEGLCRIQKELGAEYLSHTCMIYPRQQVDVPNIAYRFMNMSCREIVKRMFSEENACDLINIGGDMALENRNVDYRSDVLEKRPEIEYYSEIFEFFYELISDKKIPVETAIILGALAAQKLTELAEKKQQDRIPEALKAFRKQFHNPEQLKSIENIKPNYYLKLGFMSELMEKVIRGGMTPLLHDQTGTLNIDIYNKGEEGLRETLKGREYFLRHLALNLLFEFDVPFEFEDSSIFENYSIFAAAFGMLKLNLIATCVSAGHSISYSADGKKIVYRGDDKLIGITSLICRRICQNHDRAKNIIALLNGYKFTTPAYLALLVK